MRPVAAPHASAESERLLTHRLAAKGWEVPDPAFHPLVAEAWSAANAIYSQVLETPLQLAPWLAERAAGGCCVHLKMETLQATGSFKARGAAHKLLSAQPAALARGVHAASAGSHALAVLHAAAAVASRDTSSGVDGVKVTIHLPAGSHPAAADRLRALGAEVVPSAAAGAEDAEAEARAAAAEQGGVFVSAFNDVAVAGAQGTVALELLMQAERSHLDAVFVPVGGGGLAAGVAAVLKAAAPHVHVVGCQPEGGDAMARSVAAGRAMRLPEGSAGVLAEGMEGSGGIQEGSVTLEPCMRVRCCAVCCPVPAALFHLRPAPCL